MSKSKYLSWPQQHSEMVWSYYVLILLGLWLIATVLTFDPHCQRIYISDICSGAALILFGALSLSPNRLWAPWLASLVGIWLQLAPLIFWAPNGLSYLNDTLTGVLAIAFSLLIPGTPGIAEEGGHANPPGWSYNPSSWAQRLPTIFLACICWFCARYMAAYQLGYITTMWDPVFHNGTLNVITSKISQDFPVSDAGLGAAAYTIEALMGCKGGTQRWRTMPWSVTLFGFLVIPVGITSIVLIMLQPLVVGSWCFWCLITAACMLIMVALTIDEVIAMLHYLSHSKKQGRPFREVFWKGGPPLSEPLEISSPAPYSIVEALRGLSIPWNLVLTAIVGGWLLFYTFHSRLADDLNHVLGALVITISIISLAEVVRAARWINVLFGLIVIGITIFIHPSTEFIWMNLAVGLALILLSIPKGPIHETYGSLDKIIK